MPDERPVGEMTLAEVQAELRRITGTPWQSDADGPRWQALWRRLDELVAAGALSEPPPSPAREAMSSTPAPTEAPHKISPSLGTSGSPPDLQALVDRAGRRRAAELGEEYVEDPFKRPRQQGGYQYITADE
jgi:hypothetical protein